MITFLPYEEFEWSAQVLDDRRLGNQRVEGLCALRTLTGEGTSWSGHPCVKMWRGHSGWLACYIRACCEEWIARGHSDTCTEKLEGIIGRHKLSYAYPRWLGNKKLHESHQSKLIQKKPEFYAQLFAAPDNLAYWWPVR